MENYDHGCSQQLIKRDPVLILFVCSNMAFSGDFAPILAKHTKSFNLIDTLSVGVDRIQRNFGPCSARLNCGGRRRSPMIQRS